MDAEKYQDDKSQPPQCIAVVPDTNFLNAATFQQLDNDYQQRYQEMCHHPHQSQPVYLAPTAGYPAPQTVYPAGYPAPSAGYPAPSSAPPAAYPSSQAGYASPSTGYPVSSTGPSAAVYPPPQAGPSPIYPASSSFPSQAYPPLPTGPPVSTSNPSQLQQQKSVNLVIARPVQHKTLCEAYILWMPLGLLGFHHFYLKRYGFGLLYFFTLGVGGIGWLIDFIRMPHLVRDANRKIDRPEEFQPITVTDAYLTWFPLGLLGLHHYYLRRPLWGVAYTFTFGIFGIGWLIDACRLPSLVRQTNERLARERYETNQRHAQLCEAYILGVTPAGIFGAHHFYLGNCGFGVFYVFTLGGAGLGWIVDWFRMKWLVERSNNPDKYILGKRHKFVDDAYVLAVPFGILGAHHFYLERPVWGVLYLFTLGLGGIGWLIDLCRMPCLVSDTNKRLEDDLRMVVEIRHQLGGRQCAVQERKICVYADPIESSQPLSVAQQGYGSMEANYNPIGPQPPPPYSPTEMSHSYPGPMASEHEIPPAYGNKGFVQ